MSAPGYALITTDLKFKLSAALSSTCCNLLRLISVVLGQLKPTQKKQDYQNYQDHTQQSTGIVTPLSAVRPRGYCTNQHQNQDDDQNSSEHIAPPF